MEEKIEERNEENKTLKEKIKFAKGKVMQKIEDAGEWCKDNREVIFKYGPLIGAGVIELITILVKSDRTKTEKKLKDNYIYDRKAGHYVEAKRKIKTSEWIEIDQRHDEGESYTSILNDMGLLKK